MRFLRLVVACGLCGLAGTSISPAQSQTRSQLSATVVPVPAPLPPPTSPPQVPTASPQPAASGPAETPLPGESGNIFSGGGGADPNTSIVLDNADVFEQTDPGKWTGLGHVKVRYKGYLLTSDRVDVDLDQSEALFSGNVVLLAPNGQTVRGGPTGTLRLNLQHDTYTILGARSTVGPESLNIGILLPVFIYGGTITGRPGLIDARGSSFTTCDFLEPHYSFAAKQVYVLPGRRLVAKNVTLYRKDRRILTLPYLFVPLDRRFARQTLFPQVGQTPDEGVFIKFAFGYALASSLPGILRLDAMQKKGLGTGFEQNYGSTSSPRKGSGLFSVYRLYDQQRGLQNLTGSISHRQQFGTVGVGLNSQFQQNSYFQGNSRSRALNTQLNLTRAVGSLMDTLTTNLTQNDYGAGVSKTLTSSLNQVFQPTSTQQFSTRLDYSQYQSPSFAGFTGASDRRELDTNLDYTQRGRVVDLEVLGTKYTQIGKSQTGSGFFGGVERLPEVRLATDGGRLEALRQFLPVSSHLDLSLGEFTEPSSRIRTQRARFNLDLGTITKTLNALNHVDLGGSFQQGFYGDNTAQYILNGRSAYRLQMGKTSTAGVTYSYLRPYGFAPFQFDQSGNTNLASLFLSYQEARAFKFSLASGYDFNREQGKGGFGAAPWQNVAFQSVFAPDKIFRLRTTASYELNHNTLVDLTNTVRVRAAGGVALDIGTRYAPQQHEFSRITGNLDLPFFRDPREDAGYRLRAIGSYNGFTKRFEYSGLALTRSWHDWEGTLVYQNTPQGLRPGSTLTFNFRLKAFPAYEPFAIGQFGQALDTGLGEVY